MGDDPKPKTADDARRLILARRATFVAAALAGVACHKEPADRPEPCLSIAQPMDTDSGLPDPVPSVIPSVVPPIYSSVPTAAAPSDASGPPPPSPPSPHPCLRVRGPQVCLKVAPDKK